MKRKELTKTVMMISNCKNPLGFYDLYKITSAFQGLGLLCVYTNARSCTNALVHTIKKICSIV